ncbi:Type I secretion system ATP-binding protein PrsD [compost metagenome]
MYGLPALIVLDEPNSNLDDFGERALLEAIKQVKAQQRTLILITHKSSLLAAVDKLLVLQNGQMQAFGPTARVLQDLQRSHKPAGIPTPTPTSALRSAASVSMSYGTPRS